MNRKTYSGLDRLPRGRASSIVTPGCLVLEGGALRGTYSVGVMDALMEEDVNLQCTIGVSAGALNGISYVSGQIGRSARSPLRFRHDPRYFGFGAFLRNRSPFGFDFMFGELSRTLDPLDMERFMSPERRFVAVATNCRTGKAEYFEKGVCADIMLATRASSTMPYISRMVDMEGAPYLDGGCACKIPLHWALENGFSNIVVIKTRPDDYRRNPSAGRRLAHLIYGRKWPKLAAALAESNADYNRLCDDIARLQREGRVFVLSPSRFMDIGRMESDLEKLGEWYWLGYRDAKNAMPALRNYLQRTKA
ncbi:patatin-like phospholipase family protein [Mailhella massiliensis]|uniref:patatin-like phospholipase family protein n=1 Tax=Mailhella massiliensis TaxID=1903261 RepID=UPI00097D5860|nr:patatin family protein [Mailhella massiliensis]